MTFILEEAIRNLSHFQNWNAEEQYKFLEAIGAVNNGRLIPSIKAYWQSTQTKATGVDVTADLLTFLNKKKSDSFVNYTLVIKIIEDRRATGIDEWGIPLYTENGRDQAKDTEEELADALIYLWAMHLKKDLITPSIRNLMRTVAGVHEAMELGRL